jgi:phage terminase Nu1 subunit (DNA packaging protein)
MDLAGYKPTLGEVAALVGKSTRWIAELRANGKLPADGATLREFLEDWQELAAAPKVKAGDNATARLITAQADLAEMKAAQVKQTLLPARKLPPPCRRLSPASAPSF